MPERGSPFEHRSTPADDTVEADRAERAPVTIPDHELVRRIGRGAYGEVSLARNLATGSFRAAKIVYQDSFIEERPFRREFEGIKAFEEVSRSNSSQLALFHVGRNDAGRYFYYLMELADDASAPKDKSGGPEISSYRPHTLRLDLENGRLPAAEVLQIGLALSEALAHLHEHGLIHRDVKPSNIIFVNGRPKLADIGLVTDASDQCSIVGTEGYLPPEGPGTPQADIFALGKLLYEALTGLDRREFPQLPPDIGNWSDARDAFELNTVVVKACAAKPADRYSSAKEMLSDLSILHAGRSVKTVHARQRNFRYAKLGLAVVGLLAALVFLLSFLHQPDRTGITLSRNYDANEEFIDGMRRLHQGDSFGAIPHFERATALDPTFADAYAYLARAWNSTGTMTNFTKVKFAAERAVALNPESAFGNAVLATVKIGELDWAAADAARLRSRTLAPKAEDILFNSALNLSIMGRPKEALAELEEALRADPTASATLRTMYVAFVSSWCGQYDRALKIYDEFADDAPWGTEQHALAYFGKGDYTNAIRLEKEADLLRGRNANEVQTQYEALLKAYNEGGKEAYWHQKLTFEIANTGEEHWIKMAEIHSQLQNPEEALKCLRRAREQFPYALPFNTNPNLANLRETSGFREFTNAFWHRKQN